MLLGTLVYLVVIFIVARDGLTYYNVEPFLLTIVIWNALLLIVTILVIIDSVRKVRKGSTAQLTTGVFLVKLVAIPFFLINFALLAFMAYGGMLIFILGGFALLAGVGVGAGLTFLTMLSTSVYGWASIVLLRRERRIDTRMVVAYTLLLFVFVADTVVGILLYAHYRRGSKEIAAVHGASIKP